MNQTTKTFSMVLEIVCVHIVFQGLYIQEIQLKATSCMDNGD